MYSDLYCSEDCSECYCFSCQHAHEVVGFELVENYEQ